MPISLGDPTDPLNNQRPQTPGGTPPSQTSTAPPPNASTPNAPIPGASVYMGEESLAQQAYDNASSQLLAQRNSLYHQYGLTSTGAVDPNNPYGQYQTLLGSEGSALDAADNAALDRGLGTGGLAMQGEQSLRQGQGAQNLDFEQQVDQAGSDYASGMANATQTKGQADLQAERDAEAAAEAAGNYTPAPTPTSTTTGAAAKAKTALVKKVAAQPNYQHVAPNNRGGPLGVGAPPKPKKAPTKPYGGRN